MTSALGDWYPSLMPKIVVYVKAAEAKSLEAEGKDVGEWVRGLVKRALEKRREQRGV